MSTPTADTNETTSQPSEALQLCNRLTTSYAAIESLWGRYGSRGRGLRFTESGLIRAGTIFGYITALSDLQHPLAEPLAQDIVRWFDHLANFGGQLTHEDAPDLLTEDDGPINSFIVELHDDGTKHGFSVGWYRVQELWHYDSKFEDSRQEARSRIEGHFPQFRYQFSFNGGLLYHGPGRGEPYAVTLDTLTRNQVFWSTHT